ncbi:peptidase S10 [Polymorphobacter arshaanensis]|uniref:Peptidase S10 n=2 Tax=Glacieibacterium arshaanense TaxID=2511025 RepID=A0A4Y9ES80_9SPHN|nr:peptidase S10 [Polymorphobacter arshaanensis]
MRRLSPFAAALLATAMIAAPGIAADSKTKTETSTSTEKSGDKPDPDVAAASTTEDAQPSRHSVQIAGRTVNYTATPGTLIIRDDDGKPTASVFYTAYTVEGAAANRPVTFLFNGGPGSSTMWLHMGSVGPMRVDTPNVAASATAPYRVVPNANSLLDRSDLVFIDAVGTGYSRPLGDMKGPEFWGVDGDIDAFAKAIQRWVTKNNRWDSPKFIMGESYGTLRAAGLVYALQQRGMPMNGVMLVSSILNYGIRNPGFDQLDVTYLPSYAATAWYHKRAGQGTDLASFVAQAQAYARGPYLLAMQKGDTLTPAEAQAVATELSKFTGLSTQVLLENDLRVELGRFRKQLLLDQRKSVGRLDSRFTGTDVDAGGENPDYDAADASLSGAYVGALNTYLTGTLGYKTKLSYRPNYYSKINPSWDWKHKAPDGNRPLPVADTALDLAAAMRENPRLKVLSANGYYDMATPFTGAEYDLAHMQLDPSLRPNLSFTYYPAGHMFYIEPGSLAAFRTDLLRFYDSATR